MSDIQSYEPTNWENGDKISSKLLNNLESGVYLVTEALKTEISDRDAAVNNCMPLAGGTATGNINFDAKNITTATIENRYGKDLNDDTNLCDFRIKYSPDNDNQQTTGRKFGINGYDNQRTTIKKEIESGKTISTTIKSYDLPIITAYTDVYQTATTDSEYITTESGHNVTKVILGSSDQKPAQILLYSTNRPKYNDSNIALVSDIDNLNVNSVGSDTEYITSIKETKGKIEATKATFPTKLSQFTNDGDGSGSSEFATKAYADATNKIENIKIGVTNLDITDKTITLPDFSNNTAGSTAGLVPTPGPTGTTGAAARYLREDGWQDAQVAQEEYIGGIQIGYKQNGRNYPVQLNKNKAYVNVPWTDHYSWTDITNKVEATESEQGLMSAADKTKLDNIEENANYYTLPIAGSELGGIVSQKTGTTLNRDYKVEVGSDGKAKVNVPWTDHYKWTDITEKTEATESVAGLMSAKDKVKLDGIADGAQVGTITGINMNGGSKGTSGVVDLGTVLTAVPGNILTTAPTSANTSGVMQFVVLTSEPSTKYDGYIYMIVEK